MNIDLVIAHYNESLEWLTPTCAKLEKHYKITAYIYTKGDSDLYIQNAVISKLPNVGRESHTYLHHMIDNYETYKTNDNYIVFLQAGFFDHAPMWFKGYADHYQLINAMIQDAIKHKGASLSFARQHEYVGNNAAHWDFRIAMHNNRLVSPRADTSFGPWFVENVYSEFPRYGLIDWWVSALFCVCGSLFTSAHPVSYYEHLVGQLEHLDPEVGHYFERAWVYITGAHKLKDQKKTRSRLL